jgi:hypothetical protein
MARSNAYERARDGVDVRFPAAAFALVQPVERAAVATASNCTVWGARRSSLVADQR